MQTLIKEDVVKNYINTNGLSTTSRHREHVYRRAIIMNFLRDRGLTLNEIGGMFNRDHATVLHALKTYESQINYEDFKVIEYFMQSDLNAMLNTDVIEEFVNNETPPIDQLEFLILGCNNMKQVRKIQSDIKRKLIK